MDLFAPKDNYCERIDATFFSEPVNLTTNLGFVIVGIYAYIMLVPKVKRYRGHIKYFSLMSIIIGFGSALFHSLANLWSQAADVIPIVIFLFSYVLFYFSKILTYSIKKSLSCFMIYLIISGLFVFLIPTELTNNSSFYLGTLGMLAFMGKNEPFGSRYYYVASLFFALALCFRGIDMSVCEYWPLGTHFLWHTLNSLVILFTLLAAVQGLNQGET